MKYFVSSWYFDEHKKKFPNDNWCRLSESDLTRIGWSNIEGIDTDYSKQYDLI